MRKTDLILLKQPFQTIAEKDKKKLKNYNIDDPRTIKLAFSTLVSKG